MSEPEPIRISTSKTWVLPPRPKPGRKPLDTPTTKRKAQNRAAQRAFRERKASKIHELEESLQSMKNERNSIEIKYSNLLNSYSILSKKYNQSNAENQTGGSGSSTASKCPTCDKHEALIMSLRSQLKQYQARQLQTSKDQDKALPVVAASNTNATVMGNNGNPAELITDNESLPTPSSQHASPEFVEDSCGVCLKDECLCESIGIKQPTKNADLIMQQQLQLEKSTASPSPSPYSVGNSPFNENSPLESLASVTSESVQSPVNNGTSKFTNIIPNIRKSQDMKSLAYSKSPYAGTSSLKKRTGKKPITSPISKEIDFTNKFKPKKNCISKKQAKLSMFLKNSKKANAQKTLNSKLEAMAISATPKSINNDNDYTRNVEKYESSNTDLFESIDNDVISINPPIDNSFDPCGFCSADSPCICREASKELSLSMNSKPCKSSSSSAATSTTLKAKAVTTVASSSIIETSKREETKLTPLIPGAYTVPDLFSPLSAVSSTSSFSFTSNLSNANSRKEADTDSGCTGNPGTCRQCQTDPMSTLFCTTVASKVSHERAAPPPPSPAPQNNALPPVLRTRRNSSLTNGSTLPVIPSMGMGGAAGAARKGSVRKSDKLFIPCKDAYRTLSRHENFKYMDFGALVEMLDVDSDMMVDVSSVAKVLRSMDNRV